MAVGFVASASSGSQASVASFNIGTLGTSARAGIVFVATHNSSTDIITGVTWNSVAMTRLYRAVDTDTEPGSVVAYFLDNVTNGTITVSRTNNATVTVGYAASISAASACIVSQTVTRVSSTSNTNADTSTTGTGASGEVAVDDNSPGTNSMRFAAAYSGAATPPAAGTNSTALQVLDSTALGSRFVRETTAGQGSRNVGFATGTTDDWALVAVAVSEKINTNPQPSAASLTLTGATPTVLVDTTVTPSAASLTLTGATPTVTKTDNMAVAPTPAALTLTGATPAVALPVAAEPTAGALTLTGATPTVRLDIYAQPSAASLTLTGSTPAVLTPVAVAPTAASLALAGATPTIALPLAVAPTAASLTLTGAVPDVTTSVSDNKTALPTPAALTLTGAVPSIGLAINVAPSAGALTLTGATPTVATTANVTVQPTPGALVLLTFAPIVTGGEVMRPMRPGSKARWPVPTVTELDDEEVLLMAMTA